jgi:N-acetylmuramoyl-L-alanine amidase
MLHYPCYRANFEGAKLQNNVKKTPFVIFIFTLAFFTLSSSLPFREEYRIRTVVIDAGHGGHDSGCLGSSAKEKHVALAIALRLGKMIEETYPNVKVIYTRKTDVFIPLHERANIANKAKADLFICIHLNSGGKAAYGVESYVMGNHKSDDNLNVAKRENSAILLEDDYKTQYDGFDPNSPEANIIFTLFQSQFQHQSLLFASKVQENTTDFGGRFNRGVKQAGFLVLYRTTMPAVLIECGFLTHNQEEKFLGSDKGQNVMATSIFRAFKEYKIDMEESSGTNDPPPKPKPVADHPKENLKNIEPEKVKPDSEEVNSTPDKPSPAPAKPKPEPVKIEQPVEQVPPPTPKSFPAQEQSAESKEIGIGVQIGASKNPDVDTKKYMKYPGVRTVRCTDGFTRYVIGNFTSIKEANATLQKVKSTINKDAFLVGFNGNQRIPTAEAESLIQKH